MLDEKVVQEIRKAQANLNSEGKLPSKAQLSAFYETFRQRFGPDRLKNLDGEALLEAIHNHSNRDSLVYWLEFKNDEELPGTMFGSIAGGSALKFGIYRRKETGVWMKGSPQNQQELSTEEAIQITRNHRDQLLRGAELLERLPVNGGESMQRCNKIWTDWSLMSAIRLGDTSISICCIPTNSTISITPIIRDFI